MIYKIYLITDEGKTIYARIDDDGKCRLTCTKDYEPFQEWLTEGNTPQPPD